MNAGGSIGPQFDGHDWAAGWTTAAPYSIGRSAFLLLANAESGEARVRSLQPGGRIGNELRLTPPITIYSPEPIGQRKGLSPGDIAAANARIS